MPFVAGMLIFFINYLFSVAVVGYGAGAVLRRPLLNGLLTIKNVRRQMSQVSKAEAGHKNGTVPNKKMLTSKREQTEQTEEK